ncbi:Ig-like domain-containing protein (plasmid) [Raoultella ornithinolytica]|uniref:Ig-like domain-containing protein n=1 Tax=Raoultella ornithinolytica TaxID=54291 RepID=UPI00292A929E|nr:Ig-like domain-containing protein [Raoultella ornithinolytica]MDV1094962.1 Ig-like domain-containing protein [Raoultella ornithinolytica]MDV1122694.1 Ig-like domain-containing protein [Raoultella ornithinolytica]MDV1893209.1 Ig-like domain-containing protein [Raoultella ornithinolytica]
MPDIQVVITPENATNKAFVVASSNPEIVVVGKDNKCTALAAGEATLTISTEDGDFAAECKVIVKEPVVKVEGVTVEPSEKDVIVGDTFSVGE